MQCTKPIRIKQNAATSNDGRLYIGMLVPCGKCMSCRVSRTREWTVRMVHELDNWDSSSFITLTYDDDHLPYLDTLRKEHLQLYMKRIRKNLDGRKMKYFASGEYGEKGGRPHYHIILFGAGILDSSVLVSSWSLGMVHIGSVSHDSIQYVAGYVQKKLSGPAAEKYGRRDPPFQLQSQGLGLSYALENATNILQRLDITMFGKHVGIPRYYKKKLGIDHNMLAEKAIERENEMKARMAERGLTSDNDIALRLSQEYVQSDLDVKGRLALKESKL